MTPKIQLIKYPPTPVDNFKEITISRFNEFHSLDSYDYNFISLNMSEILDYDSYSNRFSKESDFEALKTNLNDSEDCKIIVLLPQNLEVHNRGEVKNKLTIIYTFMSKFYTLPEFKLIFGKNTTNLQEIEFQSDFYLSNLPKECKTLTKNSNGKITSVEHKNIIYTTLDFKNREDLLTFIDFYEQLNDDIEAPEWFSEVNMFDDLEQKQLIEENNNKINELKVKNENAQNKLDKNNKYKSILYKQSKPLEESVRQILQELLDYELSDFEDIGHEDFLIEFDNVTFIGEIKGVKRNLTNNHLSELDVHLTRRQDEVEDENLQPILIVNRFIKLPIGEREPVNHKQIELAENKYKCLIIDSYELLKLFEKFKKNEITTEEIINRFDDEIGLFKL